MLTEGSDAPAQAVTGHDHRQHLAICGAREGKVGPSLQVGSQPEHFRVLWGKPGAPDPAVPQPNNLCPAEREATSAALDSPS
jgi:hypothetical protein